MMMLPFNLGSLLRQAASRNGLALASALIFSMVTSAQTQNCAFPAGSGGSLSPSSSTAYIGSLSPNLNRSGESTGLDLIQYVFIDPDDLVFDDFSGTTGPRILFANDNGRVEPGEDFGMERGDQFCVFSWSFSLSVLQRQIDTLFNSDFLGVPCCLFAEATQGVDVCSLLVASDILMGSDIEDFNDLAAFAVAYGIEATFPSIAFLVDSFINVVPPGSPCTAGAMCYATSNTVCFDVDTGTSIGIQQVLDLAGIRNWQIGPNPASDQLTVFLESERSGSVQIELIDLTGRAIIRQQVERTAGKNQISLDIRNAARGIYSVRLITPEGTVARQAILE